MLLNEKLILGQGLQHRTDRFNNCWDYLHDKLSLPHNTYNFASKALNIKQ